MKIVPASGPAFAQEAVAVFFTKESFARQKKTRFEKALHRLSAAGRFEARFDERLALYDGARVQVAVGLGKESELTPTQLRVAVKHLIGCEPLSPARSVRLVPHTADEAWARAYLEGVLLGGYSWDKYVSRRTDRRVRPAQKEYSFEGFPKKLLDEALAVCRNVNYVRDLVNDNADTVNSVFFEEEISSLVKGRSGVELTVLKKKDLESLGMTSCSPSTAAASIRPSLSSCATTAPPTAAKNTPRSSARG
jgi:leucyl aminopeptidase